MKRAWVLLFMVVLAAAATARIVEIRSDVDAVLAPDPAQVNVLDTTAGRTFIVALVAHNRDVRAAAAKTLAEMLAGNAAVADVNAGPRAPSSAFIDWIWDHRFRLAPPSPEALTVPGLSRNLGDARAALRSAEGMVAGDRLLRDPTGSFVQLKRQFSKASPGPGHYDGIWESRDETAALVFVTLAERPFDPGAVTALSARIRALADAEGVEALLLGPRVVSAEISETMQSESARAGLVASSLLLAWLLWIVRFRLLAVAIMLPLACGLVAACLAVQIIFGSVHVIALGFGGVLIGLALDYSLHVLAHPGTARTETKSLVMLGALTTAIGFLSMLGSGVPALMQTGVFIAVGLMVAAFVCRIVPATDGVQLRALPFERLSWRFPLRGWIEMVLLVAGVAVLAFTPPGPPQAIFPPPDRLQETVSKFNKMMSLPSGRYAVLVEGADLAELLSKESRLRAVLNGAASDGTIGSYTMLAGFLPEAAAAPEIAEQLPDVAEFRQRASEALARSGMKPSFADIQVEEYRRALSAPGITVEELKKYPEASVLADRLEKTPQGWREMVRLFDVNSAHSLDAAIATSNIPGIEMVDLASPFESAASALRRQILIWFGIGSLVAFSVLAIGHANLRRAMGIARTTGAAVGLTAILLTVVSGPLGIFELIALTLVFGIGIDYGLFLQRGRAREMNISDYRSVGLCATSTLIAFFCFALSSVKLLHEIGIVVVLGILTMLLLGTGRSGRTGSS